MEAVSDAREEKNAVMGMFFRGGRGRADGEKGINSRKMGKKYPNRCDQSLAVQLYVERVGKLRQHVH